MNKTTIQVKNLSKIYGGVVETVALKNINLSIASGEFVSIIGPSGSGKSTLMHILGCLDKPTSGEYFLDGRDISHCTDDELADIRKTKIGFVFQQFNLLGRISVMENVMLPLVYAQVPKKEREKIAARSLEEAAFPKEFWHHFPNQLSGGMMQRAAIARALVNDPSLILADEPTGNLDSKTGEKILATFKDLHQKGRTILLVTHELYIAEQAERIISLKDGEIVEDKTRKESKGFQEMRE
ncbi:MAG TPA: ABC transporter ATP-binding protein [Candidatus Paceibacterota bacterium]|nr:ABC transporter ATP-binding protein [Candidatus Paceibacterota bacterium]